MFGSRTYRWWWGLLAEKRGVFVNGVGGEWSGLTSARNDSSEKVPQVKPGLTTVSDTLRITVTRHHSRSTQHNATGDSRPGSIRGPNCFTCVGLVVLLWPEQRVPGEGGSSRCRSCKDWQNEADRGGPPCCAGMTVG